MYNMGNSETERQYKVSDYAGNLLYCSIRRDNNNGRRGGGLVQPDKVAATIRSVKNNIFRQEQCACIYSIYSTYTSIYAHRVVSCVVSCRVGIDMPNAYHSWR